MAVLSVICGWWMYRNSHADDCQTFGDCQLLFYADANYTIYNGVGDGVARTNRPITRAETRRLMALVPADLAVNLNRSRTDWGEYYGQLHASISRSGSWIQFAERCATVHVDRGRTTYVVVYDAETAAAIRAFFVNVAAVQPK